MPHIDRKMARALVESGYMPLSRYIEIFGADEIDGASSKGSPHAPRRPRHPRGHPAHRKPPSLPRRIRHAA